MKAPYTERELDRLDVLVQDQLRDGRYTERRSDRRPAVTQPFDRDGIRLVHADCLDALRGLADATVDACVTDPPYELTGSGTGGFMGKAWDSTGIAFSVELWSEVMRVLKPGAHLLAFGGTRTSHRMVCAIEDAGFDIRDTLHWAFGTGFPKSVDVGHGLGTALKPAHEIVVLARKPLDGTIAANVLKHGTGALNIDACRVPTLETPSADRRAVASAGQYGMFGDASTAGKDSCEVYTRERPGEALGRFPPNLLLTHAAECRRVGERRVASSSFMGHPLGRPQAIFGADMRPHPASGYADQEGAETIAAFECAPGCPVAELNRQSGPAGGAAPASGPTLTEPTTATAAYGGRNGTDRLAPFYADAGGGASRFFPCFEWSPCDDVAPFFYEAKAPRSERDDGLEALPLRSAGEVAGGRAEGSAGLANPRAGTRSARRNVHPTVKPVALMRWLVRLVTPAGGLVLDPFAGSGTTGVACAAEGFRALLIEREEEYLELARARLHAATRQQALFPDATPRGVAP